MGPFGVCVSFLNLQQQVIKHYMLYGRIGKDNATDYLDRIGL